jgi:hypothetical protein
MSDRRQDTELRGRFDAQRGTDARATPSFAMMMARARAGAADAAPAPVATPRRPELHRLAYVGGLAAAAAIVALLVTPRSPSSEVAFEQAVRAFRNDPASGAWRSPTAVLLDVPGSQLMSTVPSVGTQR